MRIRISTSEPAPIYQQIMQQVKHQIAAGKLTPGQRLPSVRQLAQQITVNPNTVARAYRDLETQGVLRSRPGAGLFVAEGESPLAPRERMRLLNQRIDMLLTEASQLDVSTERLLAIIQKRAKRFALPPDDKRPKPRQE